MSTPDGEPATKSRRWLSLANLIRLLVFAAILGIMATAFLVRGTFQDLDRVGYPVIALLSFLGSASIVIPVPGLVGVCTGGGLLAPALVALVAATAESCGEITGYAAGVTGRPALARHKSFLRMERWMKRRGWLVLFLLSAIPNPIFDLGGAAAGAVRYPIPAFLSVVWSGKMLKMLTVTYLCSLGFNTFFPHFGG